MHHHMGYVFILPSPEEIRERREYKAYQTQIRLSRLAPARMAPAKVSLWDRLFKGQTKPKKYDGYWARIR